MSEIPGPPGLPLIGNANAVDPNNSIASLIQLSELYGKSPRLNKVGRQSDKEPTGPIYKLHLPAGTRVFIGSQELLNELCDETKFKKDVSGALMQVRNGAGDGLFTAFHGEENWALAHRILMPAFGPLPIREMFDGNSPGLSNTAAKLISPTNISVVKRCTILPVNWS